jgi:hypothetical protein
MGRWTQVHVFQTGSQNAATPYPRDNPAPTSPTHRHRLTVAGPSGGPGWRRLRLIRHPPRSPGQRHRDINAARGKYFHRHRAPGGRPGWRRQRLIRATLHVAPVSAAPPGRFLDCRDAVFAMRPAWQAKGWASGMIEVLAWYGRVYGAARKAEKTGHSAVWPESGSTIRFLPFPECISAL